MIEPDKKKQCDVKRCYIQSPANDLISTTTHEVSINDWGEKKCKDRETNLRNCLENWKCFTDGLDNGITKCIK